MCPSRAEPYTDEQAERVAWQLASKSVSAWRCKGWKEGGGTHERWHITSTDIHEASFPQLEKVIGRQFKHAVAFHGFSRAGVLIGGAAPSSLKGEIARAIDKALAGSGIAVEIAHRDDDLGGNFMDLGTPAPPGTTAPPPPDNAVLAKAAGRLGIQIAGPPPTVDGTN